MMDALCDVSLNRHRLGSAHRAASTASTCGGCFLAIRVLQHSGSTFKKLMVRRSNGSSVRVHELFDFLATRPSIQHPNIAPEEIINGNNGPPARPGYEDAIGFIVRTTCVKGNILDFLSDCPRRDSEKLRLVVQVAGALHYLHEQNIIHGNICPELQMILSETNILITDDNQAVLTDIGIYDAIVDFIFVPFGRIPIPPTAPYKSPEELNGPTDVAARTTDKDVYSFASSTYELMSGRRPFAHMRLYTCVVEITRRGHLSLAQPKAIKDGLWQLLRTCWAIEPKDRPAMQDVLGQLEELLTGGV